jgi:hypothetical protein
MAGADTEAQMPGSEYDIDGGNYAVKKSQSAADHDGGIAWVSGQGGTRVTDPFLLEVAGVTPTAQDVGPPLHTDWLLVV